MTQVNSNVKEEGSGTELPSRFTMQELLDALNHLTNQQRVAGVEGSGAVRTRVCAPNVPDATSAATVATDTATRGTVQPAIHVHMPAVHNAPAVAIAPAVAATPIHPVTVATTSRTAAGAATPKALACSSTLIVHPAPLAPVEWIRTTHWYSVTCGLDVGVFSSWAEVQPPVSGVSNACFLHHSSKQSAVNAFNAALACGHVQVVVLD
ncbi:hypothetical protein OBBRIDRAFT_805830 [Obba rivulosa]|uniref:Ribonuclease H1 N-terminal domain-containing protein n=1 Tax=Obba rivulosa TaxID=1052685 RepID=A0A8E2AYI8_9APHY|nr:hypothetical protein OBBRIDRAFT_805830 [Obba rivulosa]